MKIGVIGAGKMGGGIGTALARAGHEVLFSLSHDTAKLRDLGERTGSKTGSPEEAVGFGEVVLLAVWYPQLHEALRLAGDLTGKIVLTCVSGLAPDFTGRTVGLPASITTSVAEQIAELAPGARVVESFNLTFAETLAAPDRDFSGQRPTLLYCGEDAEAKQTVARLIEDCGYDAVDAGPLRSARSLESLATIWVQTAVVCKLFPEIALRLLPR